MTQNPQQAQVCIVDDNQMARDVIAEQLSLEAHEVRQFISGVQFLEKFDAFVPDVILMDVMMPR